MCAYFNASDVLDIICLTHFNALNVLKCVLKIKVIINHKSHYQSMCLIQFIEFIELICCYK